MTLLSENKLLILTMAEFPPIAPPMKIAPVVPPAPPAPPTPFLPLPDPHTPPAPPFPPVPPEPPAEAEIVPLTALEFAIFPLP